MKVAFVDTLYFVALFNPRDQWHERGVSDILTHDDHFRQEGFTVLL